MDCSICQRFKNNVICPSCIKSDIKKYRADQSWWEHERVIIVNRILSQFPSQQFQLKAEISQLKQSIDYINELSQQIPQAIFQAQEKIKELKKRNLIKKNHLEVMRIKLQVIATQGLSQHNSKQLKLKEGDRLAQKRLQQTRRALLITLGELGSFTILNNQILSNSTEFSRNEQFNDINSSIVLNKIDNDQNRKSYNSDQIISASNHNRRISRSIKNLTNENGEYLGGVSFALQITTLIARYLGVSIPFDTQTLGPFSTLYLKHDYPDYQHLVSSPLYEIEAKREWRDLLKIMVSYNQLYLQHLQQLGNIPNNKSNGTLSVSSPLNDKLGPLGLASLLEIYKKGWGNRPSLANGLIGTSIDPTFRPDFHQFLWKIKGISDSSIKGGVYTVHDNHFSPDTPSSFLDDDYDLDFSRSQLPPPHKLDNSNNGRAGVEKIDLEDEPWENVDVILPPTPSELAAAGI